MRMILLGFVLVVACGGRGRGGPDASVGDANGDGGEGELCGGFTGKQCSDTDYCDYVENDCGIADGLGTCRRRPGACPLIVGPPICGCDGKVHSGECEAYSNGADLNGNGGCVVPAGRFECGYAQCLIANQYCLREPQADGPDKYSCLALPACTGAPSCACLRNQACGSQCTGDSKIGLTLTCAPRP